VVLSSILIYVRIRTAHYVVLENILNLESIIMSPIIMADAVKKLDSSEHGYATRNDLRLVARIQDKFL
jgi:hypothetical protein